MSSEHRAGIADDPDLDWVAAADLERVDVDLDQLCGRDVERDAGPVGGGDPVAEPAADGQDHVGVLRHRVAGDRAHVPARPRVEVVIGGIAPLPMKECVTGAPTCSATAISASLASAAMTPPPARMTGRSAQASRESAAATALLVSTAAAVGSPAMRGRRGVLAQLGLQVLRDVEQDRAASAFEHRVEGLAEHASETGRGGSVATTA